jgi:DNA-binding LacI/PurR family transcriptional regulator/DNA-binding transcriptional regulator YhcF (GntR family)
MKHKDNSINDNLQNGDTIPKRIFQAMISDIENGKLAPETRLPGDRKLSEQYGTGRSSMIAALKMLQEHGYIERLPMRGTFIRSDARKISNEVKLFCPLPERAMLPENVGYGSFVVDTEITQGLITDGSAKNFIVTLRHFEDNCDALTLRRQLEFIRKNSQGVVFIGHQFKELKELVRQEGIPAVVIAPQPFWNRDPLPSIAYNQETGLKRYAEYLAGLNCASLGLVNMISPQEGSRRDLEYRQDSFCRSLAGCGVKVTHYTLKTYAVNPSDAVYRELLQILPERDDELPDILCGVHFPTAAALQRILSERNSRVTLVAFTGGGIYSLLYPQIPYLRVPCFEMGRLAAETLIQSIRSGTPPAGHILQAQIWPESQDGSNDPHGA